MYLKRLDISGFKSFAQKTVFEFLPSKDGRQSITVIVGPNGSGKSNISDAIRWVMGEQSMKQLRGKKGEDIIFSGSEAKGQLSVASVEMTFDNRDGRAAVDYEDLVIGRKIYRSGDSEYSVNGLTVRLLDLQLLLAKAQFGQGSYAVIGQGMIDRLLLQSTQERKDFFDEASGIKEFQIKRHQAQLRLERTHEHMREAELLLNEISPRLKLLSRQVKKLEQRQEVEISLREAQEKYYVTVWKYHQEQIESIEKDIRVLDGALGEAQGTLDTIQQELSTLAHGSSRQDVFAKLQSLYQQTGKKKNVLERERMVLDGKLHSEYTKSGQHQVGWLESKIVELKDAEMLLANQVRSVEEQTSGRQEEARQALRAHEHLMLSRAALKSELSSLESQLLRLKSEQSGFHLTGFRAVQAVLEARDELGGIFGVVAQLGEVEKRYCMALDVAAGGQLASLVVENVDTARHSIDFLREGKFGAATFLPLTKIRASDVPEFIRDLSTRTGVHGLARELVRFDERFRDIFSFVFGNTLVVNDFNTAQAIGIGRARMVTLEGDLFEMSGAIKGGHRRLKQQGLSFSDSDSAYLMAEHLQEEEKTIEKKRRELLDMERQYEKSAEMVTKKQAEHRIEENKRDLVLGRKADIDKELANLEQELALETMSPEQFTEVMRDIGTRKKEIERELVGFDKSLATIEQQIASFNEEEEKKKQRVFHLQDEMQREQQNVNTFVAQKNTQQVEMAKVQTKQEDLEHELYQEMHVAIETILARGIAPVPVDTLEEVRLEIQKLVYTLSLIGGIDEEVIEEYKETNERHSGLTNQLDDLGKAIDDLEELTEELDSIMKKKRDKAFKRMRKEFSRYFAILFEGGKADLVEQYGVEEEKEMEQGDGSPTEQEKTGNWKLSRRWSGSRSTSGETGNEEEVVEKTGKQRKKILTGIEIVACPPGKKINHVRALSGGERTLTSIALMCAILKTNPSPFVVLDEVEAALDEANTLRVVDILKELASESQFIVITHNRVTMHAADVLYGVTMGNDGVSKLLSVKIDDAVTTG